MLQINHYELFAAFFLFQIDSYIELVFIDTYPIIVFGLCVSN